MNTLEFAINMELEGQKYYLNQSELNKDNELKVVFELLAESEEEHAKLLDKSSKQVAYELTYNRLLYNSKSVFAAIKDFANDKDKLPKQLNVYRIALEQEEKSIQLYKDMHSQTTQEKDKLLFEFLIKQEQDHQKFFEELVKMLMRPDEWVESAEFGIREEY